MSKEQVQMGVVKRKLDKGFGFITNSETNKDIFFHATSCVDPKFNELEENATVNYTESTGRDGKKIAIEIVEI